MIPWSKVARVLLNTFTRPLAARMRSLAEVPDGTTRRAMVLMGQAWHKVNFKASSSKHKDEYYIEKGVELTSELFLFVMVLGLPIYEIYKGTLQAAEKEDRERAKSEKRDADLNSLLQQIDSTKFAKEGVKKISGQLKDGLMIVR